MFLTVEPTLQLVFIVAVIFFFFNAETDAIQAGLKLM